jgi:hypothetical protein
MAAVGSTEFTAGGDYRICRMVLAAQRRGGSDFASAWELALKMSAAEDRDVLRQTRHAWACAYDRQPFHSGGALGSWPPSPPSTATPRHGRRRS